MDIMSLRANHTLVSSRVNGYIQTFRSYCYDGTDESVKQYYDQLIEELSTIYNYGLISQYAFDSIKETIRNQFHQYFKVVL